MIYIIGIYIWSQRSYLFTLYLVNLKHPRSMIYKSYIHIYFYTDIWKYEVFLNLFESGNDVIELYSKSTVYIRCLLRKIFWGVKSSGVSLDEFWRCFYIFRCLHSTCENVKMWSLIRGVWRGFYNFTFLHLRSSNATM
mgnify:CR=1 FL=1